MEAGFSPAEAAFGSLVGVVETATSGDSASGLGPVNCGFTPVGTGDIIIGLVLLAGIFISYLPQCYSLCAHHAENMSFIMLFIGSTNQISSILNVLILQYDRFECCYNTWSPWMCFQDILGAVQIVVQGSCFIPLFLIAVGVARKHTERQMFVGRSLMAVFFLYCGASILSGGALLYRSGSTAPATLNIARVFGIVSLIGTVCCWAPQIWTTFKAKKVGALSIPMLVLQAPGSALWAYFLAFPQHAAPTTYLPFLSSCIQQFVLLFMCIFYAWKNRNDGSRDTLILGESTDARAALLGSSSTRGGGGGGGGDDLIDRRRQGARPVDTALAGRGGREQQSALAAGGLSGSLNNDGQIIQSLSDSLRSDTDLPDPETFVPPTPPTGDL